MSKILKNAFRGIGKNIIGYISVLLVVVIGIGAFAGLNMSKQSSINTLKSYLINSRYYDVKITSTLGFDKNDMQYFQTNLDNVYYIEGGHTVEFLDNMSGSQRLIARSITGMLNKLTLVEGRMPDNTQECVVDAAFYDKSVLGRVIEPIGVGGEKSGFVKSSLEVVGVVSSPFYLVSNNATDIPAIYVTETAFDSQDYSELYIKVATDAEPLSAEYLADINNVLNKIENIKGISAQTRYDTIYTERNEAIIAAEDSHATDSERLEASRQLNEIDYQTKLAEYQENIDDLKSEYDKLEETKKQCEVNIEEANKQIAEIEKSIKETPTMQLQLQQQKSAIVTAKVSYETAKGNALSQQAAILSYISEIEGKISGLEMSKATFDVQYETEKKILDNMAVEIAVAKQELAAFVVPSLYAELRTTDNGISAFEIDIENLSSTTLIASVVCCIAVVLVGVLVMILVLNKGREQIRVVKTLGYGNFAAIAHYVISSGVVGVIGCAIGFFAGSLLVPELMWNINFSQYLFAEGTAFSINPIVAAISAVVAIVCSIGATVIAGMIVASAYPADITRKKTKPYSK